MSMRNTLQFSRIITFGLVLMITALAGSALLKKDKLVVGSEAPALDVDQWITTPFGEAPDLAKGKVYVVEFWATWCVPCRMSIPHLTRLQQEWGQDRLEIIGISDEKPEDVEPWIINQGKRVGYAIATDENKATKDWMKAAEQEGIPTAFIVGTEGRIQYIGNPNSTAFDKRLNQVLRGRFDIRKMNQAAPLFDRLRTEHTRKNWKQYDATLAEITAIDQRLFREAQIDQFECRLVDQQDAEAAYIQATLFFEENMQEDPEAVIWMASRIATDPNIPDAQRNFPMAIKAANEAYEQFEKPAMRAEMLSRLSDIHLAAGDTAQALATARRAYRTAPKETKEDYRARWATLKQQADG